MSSEQNHPSYQNDDASDSNADYRQMENPDYRAMEERNNNQPVQQPNGGFELLEPHQFRQGKVRCVPHDMKPSCCCCCSASPATVPRVSSFLTQDEHKAPQMKVKKMYVILNPHSGNQRAVKVWNSIKPVMQRAGIDCELLYTERAGHAIEYAREKPLDGYDCIMAIGGDGTINEVVNGVLSRPDGRRIPVALIPGGTGNSLLTSMELTDPVLAAEAVVKGFTVNIDVGKASWPNNMRYFLNLVGWGLPADASETAEHLRCCGPLRYNIGGLWQIIKGKRSRAYVEIDGKRIDAKLSFVMISGNQHAGADLRFAPYAKLNDGVMDLTLFEDAGRRNTLKAFDELKTTTHIYSPFCTYYRIKTCTIHSDTKDLVNIDGESVAHTPVTVECLPSALTIFYHPELVGRDFWETPT